MRLVALILALALAGCDRTPPPDPAAVASWRDMLTRDLPPQDLTENSKE